MVSETRNKLRKRITEWKKFQTCVQLEIWYILWACKSWVFLPSCDVRAHVLHGPMLILALLLIVIFWNSFAQYNRMMTGTRMIDGSPEQSQHRDSRCIAPSLKSMVQLQSQRHRDSLCTAPSLKSMAQLQSQRHRDSLCTSPSLKSMAQLQSQRHRDSQCTAPSLKSMAQLITQGTDNAFTWIQTVVSLCQPILIELETSLWTEVLSKMQYCTQCSKFDKWWLCLVKLVVQGYWCKTLINSAHYMTRPHIDQTLDRGHRNSEH